MSKRKVGRPVGTRPQFQQIADDLRSRIMRSEWAVGSALPSIRALADSYQTGKKTIELAVALLKSEGALSAGSGRRLAVMPVAPGAGVFSTFKPNGRRPAKRLPAKAGALLEILGGTLDWFLRQEDERCIQTGIEKGAGECGFPLIIAHDIYWRGAFPNDLRSLPLRGVILPSAMPVRTLRQYAKLGLPVVLVDRPPPGPKWSALCVDNEKAAYEATKRLLAFGHRRIAFLRRIWLKLREIDPDSIERQRGYHRAMAEAQIPASSTFVFSVFAKQSESQVLQKLLRCRPAFTAVLAVDSAAAGRLIEEAGAIGCRVPQDLSLACFQGIVPRLPEVAGPRIDFEDLGRRAIGLVAAQAMSHVVQRIPAVWTSGRTISSPP